MQNREKTCRLFFALWPSDQIRQAVIVNLSELSPSIKGRIMRPENIHITLHFIGQVTTTVKDCLLAAAESVHVEPFRLTLDTFGYFKKARIVWMGSREVPQQLLQLHGHLGTASQRCGYQPEKRPYAPHMTLVRKCFKPVDRQAEFSIPWEINEFVLVESITRQEGVKYRVIARFSC
jgi:2'-5' RNA ligase